MAGFRVARVIDDQNLIIDPPAVATAAVKYTTKDNKEGTLDVSVSFCGVPVNFEIRNMYTNTEDLCMSCHTQGTYKYTKWGEKQDKTLVNLSPTHNINIGGQFKQAVMRTNLLQPGKNSILLADIN